MTKYLLMLLFSAGTLFAAQSPIVEIDLRETGPNTYTNPPVDVSLAYGATPDPRVILNGVPYTSSNWGSFGPATILGPHLGDITFSPGSGANVITFNDILSGGGMINVFYQTGQGPLHEVTIDQGDGAFNGGPSAVLFPKPVTHIVVTGPGSTSLTGLNVVPVHSHEHRDHGNVPMVPEANPAPLLGGILLCAVAYEARRRLVKVSAS
jgi:hypothetical protein